MKKILILKFLIILRSDLSLDSLNKIADNDPFRVLREDELELFKEFNNLKENYDNKKKKYKIRYGIKEIAKSCLFINQRTQKKKTEIFNNCKIIIDNYLDIKNLISIIQEFKIIRGIIFDKSQLSLINFYKKPFISISERNAKLVFRKSDIYDNLDNYINVVENLNMIKLKEKNLDFINKNNRNENNCKCFNTIFNKKIIELSNIEFGQKK